MSENAYLDTICGSIDKAARVLTPIFEKMNIVFQIRWCVNPFKNTWCWTDNQAFFLIWAV